MYGCRPVIDPEEAWRPGEDEPSRCTRTRPAIEGRRGHGGVGPDEGHKAMRDLVRARAAAVETLRVHRQQISAFMLKHSRIYPRKKGWTMRYLRWLQEQQFDHPAHQIALQEMVEAVRVSKSLRDRILLDTRTFRFPRAGDRLKLGTVTLGRFIEA